MEKIKTDDDSKVDAIASIGLILLVVATAVFWISHQ